MNAIIISECYVLIIVAIIFAFFLFHRFFLQPRNAQELEQLCEDFVLQFPKFAENIAPGRP